MTVIFSKKCELALQSVLYLSSLDRYEMKSAKEISDEINVPKEFVSKVLQTLVLNGIVSSRKGKNGGFYLGKPANQIRLIEIVLAIDGLEIFHNCVLGFPGCSPKNPCPVHEKWGKLRDETYKMLSESNLEEFKEVTIKKIKNLNFHQ
ncbi:Rrf2 family transcriptional regulator [Bacteroidetes/Chlorobi group bacterium ChocPot_Mid]|jgi:Rrf2 family protein|nr:MAG: Rrf2 family transcriptional regulator [Bacteroidetes/Chlorobi group bacterium ChocPot_Mid]